MGSKKNKHKKNKNKQKQVQQTANQTSASSVESVVDTTTVDASVETSATKSTELHSETTSEAETSGKQRNVWSIVILAAIIVLLIIGIAGGNNGEDQEVHSDDTMTQEVMDEESEEAMEMESDEAMMEEGGDDAQMEQEETQENQEDQEETRQERRERRRAEREAEKLAKQLEKEAEQAQEEAEAMMEEAEDIDPQDIIENLTEPEVAASHGGQVQLTSAMVPVADPVSDFEYSFEGVEWQFTAQDQTDSRTPESLVGFFLTNFRRGADRDPVNFQKPYKFGTFQGDCMAVDSLPYEGNGTPVAFATCTYDDVVNSFAVVQDGLSVIMKTNYNGSGFGEVYRVELNEIVKS